MTYEPAAPLHTTRFEIPLAEFGVSCASTATVEFSPYTQGLHSGATLYPIASFDVDHGKIRLPMSFVGEFDRAVERPWLPCPGAAADAPPPTPAPPTLGAVETQPEPKMTPSDFPIEDAQLTPCEAPPLSPLPPPSVDDSLGWLQVMVVLFGALLVMWRATARVGA